MQVGAARVGFDEDFYLHTYPDIAEAVEAGRLSAARVHYERVGHAEGRLPVKFDETFYTSHYPLVAAEVAEGRAKDALQHYVTLGAARGYLPSQKAPRPDNAATKPSPFGGLWLDAPNGIDLIWGRFDLGLITDVERDHLLFFVENGYMILPGAIPADELDRAEQALDDVYSGKYPDLEFECPQVANGKTFWKDGVADHPAKALDAHMFSSALRDVMFSPVVARMLGLLFEAKPLASQTLGFMRGSAQEAHQDSAYVAYSLPRVFAASWIALEDVSENAGELFYYPGSHRFDEHTYQGKKSVAEALRQGADGSEMSAAVRSHTGSLPLKALERNLPKQRFLAKRGDVLIWHPELAHGGSPTSTEVTRKSLVTHYCPRFNVPLFAEDLSLTLYDHGHGSFVSGSYPSRAPAD